METLTAPSSSPSKKESNSPSPYPSLRPSTRRSKKPTTFPSGVPSPVPSPRPSPVPSKGPSDPTNTFTNSPSEAPTKSDCDLDSVHNNISTIRLKLIPNNKCDVDITSGSTICNEYGFHTTTLQWSVMNEYNVDYNNIYESYLPKEIKKITRERYCLDPTSCDKISIFLPSNNPNTDTTGTDTSNHMNINNSFLPSYELRINNALQAKETIQLNETIVHYIGSSCHNKESGPTTIPTLPPSEKSTTSRPKWSEITIPLCLSIFFLMVWKRYYTRRRSMENQRMVEERNRNVNSRRRRRRRWNEEYGVEDDVSNDDDEEGNNIFEIGMDRNSRFEDQYIMDERQVRRLIILKNLIYKRVEKKCNSKALPSHFKDDVISNSDKNDDIKPDDTTPLPDETLTTTADYDDDDDDEDLTNTHDNDSSIWIGENGTLADDSTFAHTDNAEDDFDDISLDETTVSTSSPNVHQPSNLPHPRPGTPRRPSTSTKTNLNSRIDQESGSQFQDVDVFNDNTSVQSISVSSILQNEESFRTKLVDMYDNKLTHQSSSTLNSAASSTMSALKTCPICMEIFQEGDEVALSKNKECNHSFHVDCIMHWLMENDDCPICRRDYLFIA